MNPRDLIRSLAAADRAAFSREVLAPVFETGGVRLRLNGVACEFVVKRPREFEAGFHILRLVSPREAEVVRPAPLADVRRYLALFPRARFVAAALHGSTWLGLPSAPPEKGVRVRGLAPIAIAQRLQLFDTALVRFDGTLFLFESAERAATAGWLRSQLDDGTAPDALRRPGLLPAEREAYATQWKLREEMRKPPEQRRLEAALGAADAELVRYAARSDQLTVTYLVDGREVTSIVERGTLTVVSAGICLDGTDAEFDLTSLVSVLREARRRGE
ncbi:MAG: hypothetical protein IT452_01140 [Planctomycetia bacterium]|nr:hypothetical protein [Planctomycetia bacterium]